jgi:phosphoribosylamine-glycine ligase
VHARELVLQVYRFAAGKGVEVDNPAEALARKASATFVPRVRTASARARVIIPRQPLD